MSDPDARVEELTATWAQVDSVAYSESLPEEKRESPHLVKIRLLDEAEVLALEHPKHVPTLMLCAGLSYELERPDNAQAYLDALFSVDPTHADAAVLRSRIALEQGNQPYALRMLDEQIRLNPDHAGVREARAAALFLAGRHHDAMVDLRSAKSLGTPEWRIAYNMGLIAEIYGRPEDAARYYRDCLASRPNYAPAQERLRGLESGHLVPVRSTN